MACTVCKTLNTKHCCAKGYILMNVPAVDVKAHAGEI